MVACRRCTLSVKSWTSSKDLFSDFTRISFSCFRMDTSIDSFLEFSSKACLESESSRSLLS
uniref:Uncharacterized protein n=1 Tax=Arundo donax TaxID=35708 RepID=A0A0A9DDY5_ARUDO